MYDYIKKYKAALIVLHEIYGIDRFIEEVSLAYHMRGFDVFCPDMLGRACFTHSETAEAYAYFVKRIGFDICGEIDLLINRLKQNYEKVFILGFSVGATIAWKCCENPNCDGIIGCYGSRIRDCLMLQPNCPVLLLFAERDSFNADGVMKQLRDKPNVAIHKLKASHGYMNRYSEAYDEEQAEISNAYIRDYIKRYILKDRDEI